MTSDTPSWSGALLAGFRLIGRRPGAAACWALLFTVNSLAGRGAQLVWAQGVAAGGDVPVLSLAMATFNVVIDLLTFVMVGAAVMRAMIRPEDHARAWPRFGGDEFRLLILAAPVELIAGVCASMLTNLLITGGHVMSAGGPPFLAPTLVAVVLAALGARLVLAAPLAVARQRLGPGLGLGDALALTRGRHLQLAVLLVTAVILTALVDKGGRFVREVAMLMLDVPRTPGGLGSPSLSEAFGLAFGLRQLPIRLMSGVTYALVAVLQVAPLAYVYRRLVGDPEDQVAAFD